jgi:hypothetical protein
MYYTAFGTSWMIRLQKQIYRKLRQNILCGKQEKPLRRPLSSLDFHLAFEDNG